VKRVLAPRRHRVALRPKVRRRRLRLLAVAGALTMLACAAGLTVSHLATDLPSLSRLLSRFDLRVGRVAVGGVPESLVGPMESYLNEPGASFGARIAGFARQFPAVKSWQVRRDWDGRGARVEVTLRRAVAGLRRAGRPAGYLDEDGAAFAAPAELYPEVRLAVEAGAAAAAQLKGLPAVLELLFRDAELPAPLAQVRFRSSYEGWEVGLQDGTEVLWGGLDWTREKLARLHEVLSDAELAAPSGERKTNGACGIGSSAGAGRTDCLTAGASGGRGPWAADLRYFEDGRVLLKPLTANRLPTR